MIFGNTISRARRAALLAQSVVPYGSIYNKPLGPNLADFNVYTPAGGSIAQDGTHTNYVNANRSGVSDLYGNYIELDAEITCLEYWKMELDFFIESADTDDFGFYMGMISNVATPMDNGIQIGLQSNDMAAFWMNQGDTKNAGIATRRTPSDSTNISLSTGSSNVYTFIVERILLDFHASVVNSNGDVLKSWTYTSTLNNATYTIHNTGKFAVMNIGGRQFWGDLRISTTANTKTKVLWRGDSNSAGFGLGSLDDRVQNKMFNVEDVVNMAGPYDASVDYRRTIPWLEKLAGGGKVIIAGFTNDVITGLSDTYTTDSMQLIYDAVTAVPGNQGCEFITPPPSDSYNVSSKVTAMKATSYIVHDIYTLLKGAGTGFGDAADTTDGIHVSEAGNTKIDTYLRTQITGVPFK